MKNLSPKSERTPVELRLVLDRAIELCSAFTPTEFRNPIPGGGNVLTTSVGVLVAARALVEALIEYDEK
jgi:hypothetical protein